MHGIGLCHYLQKPIAVPLPCSRCNPTQDLHRVVLANHRHHQCGCLPVPIRTAERLDDFPGLKPFAYSRATVRTTSLQGLPIEMGPSRSLRARYASRPESLSRVESKSGMQRSRAGDVLCTVRGVADLRLEPDHSRICRRNHAELRRWWHFHFALTPHRSQSTGHARRSPPRRAGGFHPPASGLHG